MKFFPAIFAIAFLACGPALAEGDAPYPLRDFVMVPRGLASAIVVDTSGQAIGIVDGISASRSGRPIAIDVKMADGRHFTVTSGLASYDPVANHVITAMFNLQIADAR